MIKLSTIEEIVLLELGALSKTIKEYSTDNYIVSYAEQLRVIKYPEEKEKMIILVTRLRNWYDQEIETIKIGQYIHSKEAHLQSYKLLQNLEKLLSSNKK